MDVEVALATEEARADRASEALGFGRFRELTHAGKTRWHYHRWVLPQFSHKDLQVMLKNNWVNSTGSKYMRGTRLFKGRQRKEVVVRAGKVGRRDEHQAADATLHGQFAVLGVALRAEETGDAEAAARFGTLVLQVLVAKAHTEPGAGLVHGTTGVIAG